MPQYSVDDSGNITLTPDVPVRQSISVDEILNRQQRLQQAIDEKTNELTALQAELDQITQVVNSPVVQASIQNNKQLGLGQRASP